MVSPRWLLALVVTAAGAATAPTRDALAVLDECIGRLDTGADVGYGRISERCPDLAPSLAGSPWAAWLPEDWNRRGNGLSATGLTELRTLLKRAPPPAAAHTPRVSEVAAVLAELTQADAPRGGWWARFKRWLHTVLTPRPERPRESWLRRLFRELGVSQALLEGVIWGALALVVALAVTVLVNELRIAGLFARVRRRAPGAPQDAAAARAVSELALAGDSQQPQLLLELVTARLAEQERLPPARALTVRELTYAARLEPGDRERLRELGAACERLRFSESGLAPPSLAAALAHGRELLAHLAAAPAALPDAG